MTIHSFFLEGIILEVGKEHQIHEKQYPDWVHQVGIVLRMKPGKTCYLLDTTGTRYTVQLSSVSKKDIHFTCIEKEYQERKKGIDLYVPCIKASHLEVLLDMAVQLGVAHIHLIDTDFTEATQVPSPHKIERLKRIIKEAAEQSEQFYLPTLTLHEKHFETWLEEKVSILVERGNFVHKDTPLPSSLLLGPEGGWSPREIELFKKDPRFIPLDLHISTILRTETAAIAGLTLLSQALS